MVQSNILFFIKTRKNKRKIFEESLSISIYSINFMPALSKKTKGLKSDFSDVTTS